jgi:hypothetical protein
MGRGPEVEAKHEFTLILAGIPDLNREVVDALYEAGCDDALPSRCDGVVSMDFDRVAPSMRAAILSAIADIQKAGIGARVARVEEAGPGPGPDGPAIARDVDAINSVLQLSAAIEIDPTLRPVVVDLLAHIALSNLAVRLPSDRR